MPGVLKSANSIYFTSPTHCQYDTIVNLTAGWRRCNEGCDAARCATQYAFVPSGTQLGTWVMLAAVRERKAGSKGKVGGGGGRDGAGSLFGTDDTLILWACIDPFSASLCIFIHRCDQYVLESKGFSHPRVTHACSRLQRAHRDALLLKISPSHPRTTDNRSKSRLDRRWNLLLVTLLK